MKGGSKVIIEPHRHEGVFIARGKEDALVTLNSTPGVAVYGEKRISVESPPGPDGNAVKVEYRVWNPFRSKSESNTLVDLSYPDLFCMQLNFSMNNNTQQIQNISRRSHSWRCRQHLDKTRIQSPIFGSRGWNVRLPRIRHCRTQRQCVRGRILPPSRT